MTDEKLCRWPHCSGLTSWTFGDKPVCDRHLAEIDRIGNREAKIILGITESNPGLKPRFPFRLRSETMRSKKAKRTKEKK